MEIVELDTPAGRARAHLHMPDRAPVGALVLGHGAGGGVAAPDLLVVTRAATADGVAVALVEQPYRVAGRRAPAPARVLDEAWTAVVVRLRADRLGGLPTVTGGRSSGARVACRTATRTGSAAVLCLAFPLDPPRRAGGVPRPTRQSELDAVDVPVLVVQGVRDAFGMPSEAPTRRVVPVSADHALRTDLRTLSEAVRTWLAEVLATAGRPATQRVGHGCPGCATAARGVPP